MSSELQIPKIILVNNFGKEECISDKNVERKQFLCYLKGKKKGVLLRAAYEYN